MDERCPRAWAGAAHRRATQRVDRDLDRPARVPALAEAPQGETGPADRDTFTNDIDTIWVDEKAAFEHAQEFLQIVMPRYADRIKHYDAPEPMFHKYGIEYQTAESPKSDLYRVMLPFLNSGRMELVDNRRAGKAVYYSLDNHTLALFQQGLAHIGHK